MAKGDLRCIEGRLFRHDPQYDDPDLETDIGQCPDCSGDGCGDGGEPVSKSGRSDFWLTGRAPSLPMADNQEPKMGEKLTSTCSYCNGAGTLREAVGDYLVRITCNECKGSGIDPAYEAYVAGRQALDQNGGEHGG